MRQINLFLKPFCLGMVLTLSGFALLNIKNLGAENPRLHPLCGTVELRKRRPISNLETQDGIRAMLHSPAPKINPNFTIGQKKTFKVFNFVTNAFDSVEGVYRGGGTSCHIFVPDQFFTASFFQNKDPNTIVNQLITKFDNEILPLNRKWIGNEPNPGVDGDSKIFIFLTDVKDGAGFGGGFVAGFFNSGDQLPDSSSNPSNVADLIYMDLSPGEAGGTTWFGTLAHEFSHLIHHIQGGGNEFRWIDEGTATLIDYLFTGETLQPQVKNFLSNPNISLVEDSSNFWFGSNPFPYYGESLLFILHLTNRFGGSTEASQQEFVRKLVAEDKRGKEGVEAVTALTFTQVFEDFSLANVINNPFANNGIWSYPEDFDASLLNDLKLPVSAENKNINITGSLNITSTVVNFGNKYYEYSSGNGTGNLDLTFEGVSGAPMLVNYVTFPISGLPVATKVSLDSAQKGSIKVDGLGSSVSKVIVRVSANKSLDGDTGNSDYNFTLKSSGSATTQEGTVVPLVNPGLRGSVLFVAKLDNGFGETPTLAVTVNNSTSQVSLKKVDDSTYQGSFIFPTGFTGTYSAALSGKNSAQSAISNSFTFSHSFK